MALVALEDAPGGDGVIEVVVEGGTNAGHRPPFNGSAAPWECGCQECCRGWRTGCCGHPLSTGECCGDGVQECCDEPERRRNPGYLRRCPDCGSERPE